MPTAYEEEIWVSVTFLCFKTPLDVNLCKNQESYVKKRLGTHPEYYGNITIFGKLLDQRVA